MRSIPPANRKLHLIMCRASPTGGSCPSTLPSFPLFPCSAFQLYLSVRSAIYFYVLLPKKYKNKNRNRNNNNNASKLRLPDSRVGQRVEEGVRGKGCLHCSSHSAVVAIKPQAETEAAPAHSLSRAPLLPSPSQC